MRTQSFGTMCACGTVRSPRALLCLISRVVCKERVWSLLTACPASRHADSRTESWIHILRPPAVVITITSTTYYLRPSRPSFFLLPSPNTKSGRVARPHQPASRRTRARRLSYVPSYPISPRYCRDSVARSSPLKYISAGRAYVCKMPFATMGASPSISVSSVSCIWNLYVCSIEKRG